MKLLTDRFVLDESWYMDYFQVQHLIENCLICNMTQEECVEAISKHADIKPVITNIGLVVSDLIRSARTGRIYKSDRR